PDRIDVKPSLIWSRLHVRLTSSSIFSRPSLYWSHSHGKSRFGRSEPYMVPLSVFSWSAKKYGVIGARTASAAMPTITAVPSEPLSTVTQRVSAPPPVGTQQPTSAACGHGMSLRIGTTISDAHTTLSLNVPMRAIWFTGLPWYFRRCEPSSMAHRADV